MSDRFVLHKKIAKGGMAEIYLGKALGQDGFERVCCFKRILPNFAKDHEFIKMFRDEAHIGKRLQHANIVRIEGFEQVEGSYAIIMEFVAGADVRAIMTKCAKQKRHIDVPVVLQIISQAAQGLHYAHTKKDDISYSQLGIVHRDISPQNILVSFEGEVKVTDFGIANIESKISETKTGVVKGKFAYMSPEQIAAQNVDARTDVFALSVILWEMLAMKRLFYAETDVEMIKMVSDCVIRKDISALNDKVDEELKDIVYKGLKKDPEERYQTAAELQKDLRRYLNSYYEEFTENDLSAFLKDVLLEERKEVIADVRQLLSKKSKAASFQQKTKKDKPFTSKASASKTQTTKTGSMQKFPKTKLAQPVYKRADQSYEKKLSRLLKKSFYLIIIVALGFVAYKAIRMWQAPSTASLSLYSVPEEVRISLNGSELFGGEYIKTPVKIPNLNFDTHKFTLSRPGFEKETLEISFNSHEAKKEENIVLKPIQKMAPTLVKLKAPSHSVKIVLDQGLLKAQLSTRRSVKLRHITFGDTHSLKVYTRDDSSFECEFIPRSQVWSAPFIIMIDPLTQECSYPLE